MDAIALLEKLRSLHVKVEVINNQLKINAPKNTLTPELVGEIKSQKQALIDTLKSLQKNTGFESLKPVLKQDFYEVSSAQRRLYFLYEFNKSSLAYNLPSVLEIEGNMDQEKLLHAFQQLMQRHESLRTRFELRGAQPIQIIEESQELPIVYLDASGKTVEALISAFVKPFDLNQGPMIRVALAAVNENHHFLMMDIHHIITDGVSQNILNQEFIALYNGMVLPPLQLQYKDFAVWQNSEEQQAKLAKQAEFWAKQFEDVPEVLQLPYDFPRPKVQTNEGDKIVFELDEQTTTALNELANQHQASVYMLLLAVYTLWLSKLSNQNDLVVGTSTAGRRHSDLDKIIGIFTNPLAIRNRINPKQSFTDFLKEVRVCCLQTFDNQDYLFEDLVESLQLQRDTSRNPLFDVMFDLQNMEQGEIALPNLKLKPYQNQQESSKFDLTLTAVEQKDTIHFKLQYASALFKAETIERYIGYFQNILKEVIQAPQKQLAEISLLDYAEEHQLANLFDQSTEAFDYKQVVHLFEEKAAQTPEAIALSDQNQHWTYQRLNDTANQLARFMKQQYDLQANDVVGILLDRSAEAVLSMLAVLKSGAAFLPIETAQPSERIQQLLKDAQVKGIILESSLLFEHTFETSNLFAIDIQLDTLEESPNNLSVQSHAEDTAYVIYTSGSTGMPKGVMVSHQNISNYLQWANQYYFKGASGHHFGLFTSIAFDLTLTSIFSTLLRGDHLQIFSPSVEITTVLKELFSAETKANALKLTPSHVSMLKDMALDTSTIQTVILGGEQLLEEQVRTLQALNAGMAIYNEYGPTEATVGCTVQQVEAAEQIHIGTPISGAKAYVLNPEFQLVPEGIWGELVIGGIGVAKGYLNRHELTKERFLPDFIAGEGMLYKTGDRVRWIKDSQTHQAHLEYQGRLDDQVKIRGYRVELGEVNAQISQLPDVIEAFSMVKGTGQSATLYSYFTAEKELQVQHLKQSLQKLVPDYLIPANLIQLDSFPLTVNGKIDKKKLPNPVLGDASNYQAPQNEQEAQLVAIWEEVLEIKAEAISTTQSFFDLGGNSLKGVFLVNKIQQAFGVELPLQTVFNTPTIVALVEAIGTTKRSEIEAITKVEERPYYPVASSQKRLYFLYEFDKEATTYNMPLALKLEGKLDLEKCHQAFQILVHSHEVLRTSFDLVDGEPVQLIHPEPQAAIEQFAIDAADETGIQQIIQNFIRPFDLKQAPLIRVGLIQLENAAVPSHILLLDLHHIITDGVTQNILTKEFINIYHGEALPKLEIQYKDFAVWQQSEAQQERIQAQSKFWLDRFQGDIPYLTLPYDFPRPSIQSHQGTTYQFALDEQLSTDLNQLCKAQNVSLYMLLLAIYQIMLSKLSQQEDIIVGTSTAGRRHASMENMMGIFTNVLALRNFPKPEKSFVDFLAEVRESTITTFDHQDFLFEDLVEQLQLKRNTSRNPLFDVMFDLQNIEEEMLTLPNLKVSPYAHERTTARFDLTFTAREVANQIDFTVEYATELFTEASIAQFGNYFQYIAQQVVEDAAQRLGNIQLLKGDIQQDLIQKFDFQQKAWGAGASIQGLVEQAALANPQHIACHMGTQILTYQQLNEQANQLAHFLKENFQLQANDVVAILLERSPEAVIALLGTLKAGAAFLPIDRQYPANRIQYILNDAQVKGAIIHSEMLFDMEFPTPNIFAIDIQLETLEDSTENLNVVSTGEDSAYVIYTSGSTGNPKGVVVSQQNACNYLLWANQYYFGGNSGFHFPLFTSLAFDLTLTSVFTTLLRGDQIHIFNEQQDMSKTLRQIMEPDSTINAVKLTPSHVRMIQELNIEKSNVSHVILGGEKLQAHHIQTLQALNAKLEIFNEYGPTETTVGCTVNQVSDAHDLSIGHPIDGAVAYVFNEQVQPQAFGVWGELYIGGIGVSKGYLNNEALTAERFIQNPITQTGKVYKTGDIARWLPNGTLEYLGRSDDQVKLRGYRIELAEVETSLLSHPDIKEAVALVKELADDQALCAYFTAEKEVDAQTIRTHLQQRIPEYMIPNHFIQVEAFELTVNGKIDKAALPAWKSDSLEPSNYVPPRNEQEAQIAAIWQEVLKVAQVGITDDYFALGGDSLKAVRVIAQINDQLNLQLEVKDLFAYPTIEGLQQVIEEADYEQSTQAAWKRGMLEIDELKAKIIQEEGDKLPENYEDIYPFTPIETGMIYSSLLNPAEPIYNDQFIYPIEIANQELFMSSLKKLLVRHPILRTLYYRSSFSEPIKVVVETLENPLQTSDLRGQAQADQISVIKNYLQNDLAERISFNGELLWHVHLFQLAETSYVLVWTVHHAVLDGWSVSTFNTELSQLIANESLELPALRHTYKDYCAITLGKKTSENVQDFWKTTLADYTRNKLPFNYAGKQKRNSTGSRMIRKPIDPAVLPKLEAIASEHHISLKSICLAAHVYLMHLICSETDVVTGVVSHDRPAIQDADKILGCFLNTVPVRIQVEHVTNSLTLIKEVNQYLIKAKVNEIHLGDIAAAIGERTSKENPIFDCLLNFTDFHIHEQAKITNELYHNEALLATAEAIEGGEMTNTWFDLEVDKTFDVLSVKIKYLPAYFEDEEMHYALELYMRILKHFAAGVEQALNPSVLLNEEERNELLYQFNDTILPYSKEATLHQLFENQAEKTPNHPALRCKGEELSYQELNKKSNALARFLLNHGVKNDDNVALIASRDFNMIIGMFAILKAGAAYVPIDPDYPLDRQSYIIENSNVNLALLDAEYEISQSNQVKCILIKEEAYQHLDSNNLNLEKDTTELAYTIYTSGSTGRPKGVMIEHHSAVNLVEWVNKEFKVNADDRLLFITSMCFDLSVYDIFGILAAGGTVVMASKEDVQMVDKLKTLLKNENITFWDSVPTTMNYLISELEMTDPTYQQHDLRLVFMSGDWIPVNLPDRIKNHFPNAQPISLGGATEGTVWSNYFPIHEVGELWPSIPYGKPIDNNFFYILDKDQHPVPKGVVGELYIGGVGVARGYANDSEKTNRAFVDDPFNDKLGGRMYRTGDLGRMLPNNQMEFLGRKDHQVKIRGFRIELGEIESCLEKYPSISQAVVLAKGEKTDKYLCAYFTSSEKVSPATLRSHILESLPDYMVPGYFVHLDKFPVNTNGKVDRKQLPAVDQAAVSEETYVAPSNPIEAKIIALWQDLLNIQGIGASDNFFELGGHSLTAVRLVDQLKRAFGVNLPIAALFQAPIVTQLAQVIQQAMHQESKTQLLVPLKPTGSKTPIFLVPPIMGTALSYANLVKHISDDQPVYGLQTSGLEAGQEIHTTMEDMAACYIAEIKKMQAAGPYILAGWSFGGLIAFEMAQQLKATGDQVQKLVLFDTNSEMESANKTDLAHELSFLESGIMLSHLEDAQKEALWTKIQQEYPQITTEEARLSYLMEQHQTAAIFDFPEFNQALLARLLRVWKAHSIAGANYQAQVFEGHSVLFRASELINDDASETRGWDKLLSGEFSTLKVGGSHATMLQDPHAAGLAQQLEKAVTDLIDIAGV